MPSEPEVDIETKFEAFERKVTGQWDASAPIHTKIVNWSFVVIAIAVIAVGLMLGLA